MDIINQNIVRYRFWALIMLYRFEIWMSQTKMLFSFLQKLWGKISEKIWKWYHFYNKFVQTLNTIFSSIPPFPLNTMIWWWVEANTIMSPSPRGRYPAKWLTPFFLDHSKRRTGEFSHIIFPQSVCKNENNIFVCDIKISNRYGIIKA